MRKPLFSNGSSFMSWRNVNCDQCKYDVDKNMKSHCPMEEAIALNMAGVEIPEELQVKYFGRLYETNDVPDCKLKNVDLQPEDPRQVKLTEIGG